MGQLTIDLPGTILLFGTLAKILQTPPEQKWIQIILDEKIFDDVPFGGEQASVVYGQSLIRSWTEKVWNQEPEAAFAKLEADYYHLFLGPGKVLAPPWESVYASTERLVFQEETLAVRRWYRKYGLQIEELYHEPDDHIGLELAFIANLFQLSLQAFEHQDSSEFSRLLTDLNDFLQGHPMSWAPTWLSRVDQHARTDFYRGIGHVTLGALQAAAELVKKALAAFV